MNEKSKRDAKRTRISLFLTGPRTALPAESAPADAGFVRGFSRPNCFSPGFAF